MDVRPLLRLLAIVALAIALVLGLRARRAWPARRVGGLIAGALAVLALAGIILSALDLLARRAPVPDALLLSYVRGEALEVASAATGAVRWSYQPLSGIPFGPTIDHGVIYLGDGDTIRAMRAGDGRQLWVAPVNGRVEYVRPAIDGGVVYATALGGVFAVRAIDGSPLWRLPWSASDTSGLSVTAGVVYAAAFNPGSSPAAPPAEQTAIVYALGASDGAVRWTFAVQGQRIGPVTVAGGIVYVATSSGGPLPEQGATVYALGASDGAVRWKYGVDDMAFGSLTVTNGVVYVRSFSSGLVALDAASGKRLWQRRDLGAGPYVPLVAANGAVYLGASFIGSSPSSAVLALDARDGSERWRTLLDYSDHYLTISAETLYTGGGSAYALRTSDGHVVWRYGSGALFYQPMVRNGVVFLGSSDFPNSDFNFHPFGIGSQDFLNALNARTGELYWRSSGSVEGAPVLLS